MIDSMLSQLGGSGVKMATGSYVGDGTYGPDNPNTLTFEFAPKLFIFNGYTLDNVVQLSDSGCPTKPINMDFVGTSYTPFNLGARGANFAMYIKKSSDGKTITWYSTEGTYDSGYDAQQNISGATYRYTAIG